MTLPNGQRHELSMDEVAKIGAAVGPGIRERMRSDFIEETAKQTKEIRDMISGQERAFTSRFESHEKQDELQFKTVHLEMGELKKEAGETKADVKKINTTIARWGGGLVVVVFLMPIIIEVIKWMLHAK